MVNEIGALTELTSLVRQLAVGQHQPSIAARVCGIYTSVEHPTDMCLTLQETESDYPESVGAIGGYQYGKQPYQSRPFDNQQFGKQPFWLGSSQGPYAAQQFRPALNASQGPVGTTVPTTGTIENASSRQFTISRGPDEAISNKQPGVLANHELQQYAVSAKYERHRPRPQDANKTVSQYCEPVKQPTLINYSKSERECKCSHFKKWKGIATVNTATALQKEKTVPLSFLTRTISTRKPKSDEELLRMFRKVEINIPLLDAIKKIPKYAKFLKELWVHKRKKMKGSVEIGGIVSMLTRNEDFATGAQLVLPKKCRDPEIFCVPCTIGDCTFADAMLDLGASINVMPNSIYKSLNFGDLEPTGITIQLENKSVVQPLGVLEDVLVQVDELIFLVDFYVLDMEDETPGKGSTLILGQPFLMTMRTKIDAEIKSAHLVPNSIQVGQPDPKESNDNSSSSPPPMELKSLPSHMKYAYLDATQQLPVIIASNLCQKQEGKLLNVLRQHKKAIGWKLSNLPRINPSIYMHRILIEEESKPIKQQQRRMNLTILDVVKKKVTKLLAAGIIYPISDSQWVSPVQVVPKRFGMTDDRHEKPA
ncbi:hypothetical protein CR513_01525, partial [Mucuna pruriens]